MGTATFRRVFKAFQYRDFRLMWVGACTSSIGTWMQIVAQGWLIYRLSHSARLLALDQFLGGIPIFLFSLLGGVVADRIERRKILVVSQYIQMASAAYSRCWWRPDTSTSGTFSVSRSSPASPRRLADLPTRR
jgi:MFS family permease